MKRLLVYLGLYVLAVNLPAGFAGPTIPYHRELLRRETIQLPNSTQAEAYLYKQTDWQLKSMPQSALASAQQQQDAMQMPEAERLKVMDKFEDFTQLWIVSLQQFPQADATFKRFLPVTTQPCRYHRELAYLGRNDTEAWYAYMPIYEWIQLRRQAGLNGGDDVLAAAARGLSIQDQGTMTRNSSVWILAEAGAPAIPYLQPLLAGTNSAAALSVLGTMKAPEAATLLVQIATGPNPEPARAARNLLQYYPRLEARVLYFQWLDAEAGKEPVYQLLQVCAKMDRERTAKFLPRILANPKSVNEYRLASELAHPIPQKLLQLEQDIKTHGYASSTNYNQSKVDAATTELIRSTDPQSATAIGLSLATAVTKGDWRPANQAGLRILASSKEIQATARRVVESIHDPHTTDKLKSILP